jgi:hypothetical protein
VYGVDPVDHRGGRGSDEPYDDDDRAPAAALSADSDDGGVEEKKGGVVVPFTEESFLSPAVPAVDVDVGEEDEGGLVEK